MPYRINSARLPRLGLKPLALVSSSAQAPKYRLIRTDFHCRPSDKFAQYATTKRDIFPLPGAQRKRPQRASQDSTFADWTGADPDTPRAAKRDAWMTLGRVGPDRQRDASKYPACADRECGSGG